MLDKAHELYNNLLNTYKTQNYKLRKDQKKMIKVKEGGEEVKLVPEETIPERIKLNPQKRKIQEHD